MRFICEDCDNEMDFDEDINEIIICDECGGNMYGVEE
jgi:Zn finger protein HypA/HybF involved in hydrogenase expression